MLPHKIAARLGTSKPAAMQPAPQLVEPPAIIAEAEADRSSPTTIADIIRAMVEVRDERRNAIVELQLASGRCSTKPRSVCTGPPW